MFSFDPILAEAYRRAALAGRDMYAFVGQVNRVKAAIAAEKDLYGCWERLEDLIGEALQTADPVQDLQLIRKAFTDQLDSVFTGRILETGATVAADWQRWQEAFSEASFHWRLPALQALCQAPGMTQRFGKKLEPYQQFIRYFFDRRWVETRAVFWELASEKKLPEAQRGYHYYICGQIDVYFHYDYAQAKSLFEKAREMLSGNPLSVHGLIEYYLKGPEKDKDPEQALALADEALALDSGHVPSMIQKADVLLEKGQLAEAENLYREASRKRPGYSQCYTRLIDLYGKAEFFEKKENSLAELLDIVEQLDPETGFLTRTDLGGIYQQQGEQYYDKAETYHKEAIEQYPEGIVAPLNLGYLYMDYTKQLDQAAATFEAVRKRVPDAWESVLAIARLYEAQGKWEDAMAAIEQVQQRLPSWERFMQTAIGRIARHLGRLERAETALLRAWKLDDSDDSGALSEIYELAQALYKDTNNPQPEQAVAFLKQAAKARKNIPKELAAGIANRQGHVYYYIGQYAEALPLYRKAAELVPDEPVYFTNQFDCLEKLYRQTPEDALYQQAQEALENAGKQALQDASIAKKRRQLALLRHNPDLAELPPFYPVHVEVGQPLLSQITTDYVNLLPEMTALTDALRSRITERFAITLPGLRYRDISDGDGVFQFRLYETPVWLDRLHLAENEEPTMAAVLDQFEQFITNYCLDLFVNYWDVDREVPLLPNTELVHFTRVIMALLTEQTPLPPLPEVHQQYRRLEGLRQPVAVVVEQLRLWDKLRSHLPGVQDQCRYIRLGEAEETRLASFLIGEGNTRALALPMDYTRSFLGAIIRKTHEQGEQNLALVTRQESLRPYLRSVLAALPRIPVLKTTELLPGSDTRFIDTLLVEASDDALFLQTFQQIQAGIAPDTEPPKS